MDNVQLFCVIVTVFDVCDNGAETPPFCMAEQSYDAIAKGYVFKVDTFMLSDDVCSPYGGKIVLLYQKIMKIPPATISNVVFR